MDRLDLPTRPTPPELIDAALAALRSDPASVRLIGRFQTHAAEVARRALELACRAGVDHGDAHAGGLLHDVGEMLLLRRDPVGYSHLLAEVGADHRAQLAAERAAYGTDHALIGAEHLLDHRLPHVIADAVADHHDPYRDSDPVTIVVAAADELVASGQERRHAIRLLETAGVTLTGLGAP